MAKDPTRCAINGALLEVDGEEARVVATDGRRLVAVELDRQEGPFGRRAVTAATAPLRESSDNR